MTAYEFANLRYSKQQVESVKSKYSSPSDIAEEIERNMKINLRVQPKYEEAKDMFIELTMSCNTIEAKRWMTYWMLSAKVYGDLENDLDWRYFYLAAYDIYVELG